MWPKLPHPGVFTKAEYLGQQHISPTCNEGSVFEFLAKFRKINTLGRHSTHEIVCPEPKACTKTSWSTSLCMLVSCLALWVKPRGTWGRPIFVLMSLSARILVALKTWKTHCRWMYNDFAYCHTCNVTWNCWHCNLLHQFASDVLFSSFIFTIISSLSLSSSFHLCSMKWNRTEFLYHPQLLQVQIINKETEDKPSKAKRRHWRRIGEIKQKGSLQGLFVFIK